ncbi:MAG: GtrA family protein, partial [Desulfosporosinus sp.]
LIVYSGFVYFGVHYQIANVAAFILSSLNGFLLNRTWVFKAKSQSFLGQGLRYYLVYCSSLLISMALSYVWIEIFFLNKYLVPFINLTFSVPYNYVLNKIWTFTTSK